MFSIQLYGNQQFVWDVLHFCQAELSAEVKPVLSTLILEGEISSCSQFFFDLEMTKTHLDDYVVNTFQRDALVSEVVRFREIVPGSITSEMWFDPKAPKLVNYFTSAISHADWQHLAFNLVFFFAFSLAVEQTLGSLLYLLFSAATCVVVALEYQYNLLGVGSTLPLLGLSGLISALMGFVLCVYPRSKAYVWCWLLVFVKTIRLPIFLLVPFYIALDIYGLSLNDEFDNISYESHLSGFATGIVCAFLFLVYRFAAKRLTAAKNLSTSPDNISL
ncbi:rhomboid family intramembrane serine protease [Simiduia litorea]|uniref:rhomboid family intramembrane serine protease n=1 Tax=Simiduia litorea TaxID=1435348 RepID=UPI0036F23DC4